MALFEDEPHKSFYSFSRFDSVKDLVKNFLMEYPRNKISCKYFRPLSHESDVAGICCSSDNSDDASLLDDLFGYIDIPASMSGFVCDIVRKNPSVSYLMVYDQNSMHEENIRSLNFVSCGKF